MRSDTEAERIAAKLTPLQAQMLLEGAACGTADQMVELGLWKPEPGVGAPYYVSTDLGLRVRRVLEAREAEHG